MTTYERAVTTPLWLPLYYQEADRTSFPMRQTAWTAIRRARGGGAASARDRSLADDEREGAATKHVRQNDIYRQTRFDSVSHLWTSPTQVSGRTAVAAGHMAPGLAAVDRGKRRHCRCL
eukprot:GHVU01102803.1.p3 GENE.GHVU01102803.1~~GHVU01102803.1.p3  ORF type:complete len:119 (-),score=7.58 GHVU01102803.1:1433-1789(-)